MTIIFTLKFKRSKIAIFDNSFFLKALERHVFKIYSLFFFRRPSCYRRHHRRCLIMRTTPFLRQQLIGPMAFFPLLPRNYVRYNCFVCEIDLLMCMYAWKTTKNKRKALRKKCVSVTRRIEKYAYGDKTSITSQAQKQYSEMINTTE